MDFSEEKKNGALIPSRAIAAEVIRVFPLARFSATVEAALGENRDSVATQHLHCIFQLRAMHGLYGMLQAEIPGIVLAFPMFFGRESDGTERIMWVGEYDPFNLENVQAFHALTRYKSFHGERRITTELQWGEAGFGGIIPDFRAHLGMFLQIVRPAVFDEVFTAFFRTSRLTEPCQNHDEEGKHPMSCAVCGGKGILLIHETFTQKFRPSAWLSLVLGIEGWDVTPR